MSGVRSINLSTASIIDELIGHRDGSSVRISAADFARQIRADEQIRPGWQFYGTDDEMASMKIPEELQTIRRYPLDASPGQVAPVRQVTDWARAQPPTSDPYFVTDLGAQIWVQVGYREQQVLSVVQSAIAGAAADPSFAGVQPFATRAAFSAATLPAVVQRAAYILDGRAYTMVRSATGSIIQANGQRWVPDGPAYVGHYGASVGSSAAANLTAFRAALAAHSDVVVPRGMFELGGQLRITGFGKALRGEVQTLAPVLSFTDTFDGPAVLFEPQDPLATVRTSKCSLSNLDLAGNGSTRLGRWALDIRKQEHFCLENVRWGGFSFGLREAGCQLNVYRRIRGDGSGLAAGVYLPGSTQIWIGEAETADGVMPSYCSRYFDITVGGGTNKNIQDIITLSQTDGHTFVGGYVNFGNRSLLRLEQVTASGTNLAVTNSTFVGVYFDGVRSDTGTQHFLTAKDEDVVGQVTMDFVGCSIVNFQGRVFDLDHDHNLRAVQFTSCRIGYAATGLGVIKGVMLPDKGMRISIVNCEFMESPGRLRINNAMSVRVSANFSAITDAGGCLELTGTIYNKQIDVLTHDCAAGVVDTSTGSAEPDYEWQRAGVFVPGITIGGVELAAAGGSYGPRTGEYVTMGDLVWFRASISLTTKAGTGVVRLTGLPFPAVLSGSMPVEVRAYNLTPGTGAASAFASHGSSTLDIQKWTSTGHGALTDADLTNTTSLQVTAVYRRRQ